MTENGGPPPKPRRKPKDILRLRGQRIITEEDLDRTFPDDGEAGRLEIDGRRVLHGFVLVFLVFLLVAAVVAALAVMRGDLKIPGWDAPPVATAPEACPTGPFDYPDNGSFTVNVYNPTNREGLAGDVSGLLADRGYKVGEVASKEFTRTRITAAIISGPAGQANAFNLQRNIPGTEYRADERTDDSVDVIVGEEFKELVPENRVDQTPGPLSCPHLSPEPTPSE